MENPYKPGTTAHQNFNTNVNYYSSWSLESLKKKYKDLTMKSDNFLNYSDSQRIDFEREALAVMSVIDSKQSKILELIESIVKPVLEKGSKEVVITKSDHSSYKVEFRDEMGLIERLNSFEPNFENNLKNMVVRVLELS